MAPPNQHATEVFVCYRGRFKEYAAGIVEELRRLGYRVAYDREVLDSGVGHDAPAEVEWRDFSGSANTDTSWRAPIRAAIDKAELVAFAYEEGEPTDNLLNEMRWAIKSGAHVFFLIHGDVKREARGVVIGTLAMLYTFTLNQPTYPEFGFHFCGDLGPANFRAAFVEAANRIAADLGRYRRGEVRIRSVE